MTSQCSFSFQKNDFIPSFSKIKGGSETGNPTTNHQYSSVDGHSDGLQLFIFSYLFKGGPDNFFCLLGSLFLLLLMDPTTLFPNIGNLTKIRIHPLRFESLPKGILMHAGGATGHHYSIQILSMNGLADALLSRFSAHVDVIGAVGNIFNLVYLFSYQFDIHCSSNIHSALADKNTQSFHKNNLLPLGASGKAQGVPH